MNIVDIAGFQIDVGDIVLYTAAGAGRALPPLEFGEVVALTKAGVTVIQTDKDFKRQQVEDYYMRATGQRWGGPNNDRYEKKEKVVTGYKDSSPENIRFYKNRFYIVRKI